MEPTLLLHLAVVLAADEVEILTKMQNEQRSDMRRMENRMENKMDANMKAMENKMDASTQSMKGDFERKTDEVRGEIQCVGLNLQARHKRHNGGTMWRSDQTNKECKLCPARNGDG